MKFLLPIAYFFKIVFTPTNTHWDNLSDLKKVKSSIHKAAIIDHRINESSGLVYDSIRHVFYTLNDSGGDPIVYVIDSNGACVDEYTVANATNKDWEEIQWEAATATFWIGDIGNNANRRKNLCLYSYRRQDSLTAKYPYSYSDQHEFPPMVLNFDAEAFVKIDTSIVILSKNRSKDPAKIYLLKLGDTTANYYAEFPMKGMVTGASILPMDSSSYRLAVLTYGWIYFYRVVVLSDSIQFWPYGYRKFLRGGQNEGIAWKDAQTIFITNEKGKLFKMKLKIY